MIDTDLIADKFHDLCGMHRQMRELMDEINALLKPQAGGAAQETDFPWGPKDEQR